MKGGIETDASMGVAYIKRGRVCVVAMVVVAAGCRGGKKKEEDEGERRNEAKTVRHTVEEKRCSLCGK